MSFSSSAGKGKAENDVYYCCVAGIQFQLSVYLTYLAGLGGFAVKVPTCSL